MRRADFTFGTEFGTRTGQRRRCTDVGQRSILAIELPPDLGEVWCCGPPYVLLEASFDEIEMKQAHRTAEDALQSALESHNWRES